MGRAKKQQKIGFRELIGGVWTGLLNRKIKPRLRLAQKNRKEIGMRLSVAITDTEDFVREHSKHVNPTIGIQLVLSFFWLVLLAAAFGLEHFHPVTLIPIFVLQTLIVFMLFTPLHESTHFIGDRKRWRNEMMLFLCWPIFLGNPFMFRRIHIQHHARTNSGDLDPDHFTSASSFAGQLTKSFLLFFYYHVYGFKNWRTWGWRAHLTASAAIPILMLYLAVISPFTWSILFAWILPSFVGTGLLAFANTAWPHHTGKQGRTESTKNTYVPWIIQLIMLNQNLHQVHHLKPNLPWYEYPEYWREHKDEILKQGAKLEIYTSRAEPYSLVPEKWQQAYRDLREAVQMTLKGH